jgi:hypothetical protein
MPNPNKVFGSGPRTAWKTQRGAANMNKKFLRGRRPRLSYANVVATLALFLALGGAAVAAGLPRNSVGPSQLKKGAVTAAKIKRNAVTAGKISKGAVGAGKLGANAVLPSNLGKGIISSDKLANGAVIAASIKNGVVTNNKLQNGVVSTAKLADGAVNSAKLADKSVSQAKLAFEPAVAGTVTTLKTGQTLRGVFDVGAGGKSTVEGDIAKGAINFSLPLLAPATATILKPGETTANCAGLGGGNSTPSATPGNLCIYLGTGTANIDEADLTKLVEGNSRLGFGISVGAKEKEKAFSAIGQWAVTAP